MSNEIKIYLSKSKSDHVYFPSESMAVYRKDRWCNLRTVLVRMDAFCLEAMAILESMEGDGRADGLLKRMRESDLFD